MHYTSIDSTSLSAADAAIPKDTPVLMLNLLRWKPQADYSGHPEVAPCTGQEAYFQHYIPAFNAIASGIDGIQLFWVGTALAGLVAPAEEKWDMAALVKYPSFAAFRAVTDSKQYKETAQHHRLAALEDWRLIATVEQNTNPSE